MDDTWVGLAEVKEPSDRMLEATNGELWEAELAELALLPMTCCKGRRHEGRQVSEDALGELKCLG